MADEPVEVVETTATEPVVETQAAEPVTLADKAMAADPGSGKAGGEAATSVAEAISAGIDSAPKKGDKAAGDVSAKVEGEKPEGTGEAEKETDEAKAAKQKAEDDAAKEKPDHVNDPIDPKLSERAQERIRSLVGSVKERDEQLQVQGTLINAIQETGASPEQFAEVISFLRDANSNTPEGLERSYQMLRTSLRTVSLKLGKALPEVDLLADHKDLNDAVKFGQITKEHANELALAREQTKMTTLQRERATATTKATQDAETEKNTAITELNELGQQLAKADPDYQRKFDLIVKPLQAAFQNVRPSLWKNAFKQAYDAIPALPAAVKPAATVVTPAQPAAKKGNPIRPIAPAGDGGRKAPASALEALSFGIDQAR